MIEQIAVTICKKYKYPYLFMVSQLFRYIVETSELITQDYLEECLERDGYITRW